MRDNWNILKLGDVAQIQKGKISEQSTFPRKGFAPIINTDALRGDIKVWGKIENSVTCDIDDILILWDGERSGLCAIGFEGVVGSTFAKLKVSKILEPSFLYRFIDFNFQWIQNQRTGTGVPHVPKDLNKILEIPIPPLPQQHKIAQILTTCDAVIEKTEAAIAKYQAMKQGLIHDLFTRGIDVKTGKLRPKQQDAPELYKESALGWIPKEWEVKRLEDLCSEKPKYGINAAAVKFNSNLPTYLRITDIDENGNFSKTGRKSVDNPFSDLYYLKKGDVVFARTGATVGKTYLYNENDGALVYAGFLIKASPNKNILDANFLKFLTETSYYLNWVTLMSQRSGQPGINGAEYGSLKVATPDIKEQKIISDRLLMALKKIQTEQSALSKYQQLKTGLMQDLLSGKVEVKV